MSGPNASDFRMTFGLVRKDEVSRPLCPPGDREEIPSIRRAEPHPGKIAVPEIRTRDRTPVRGVGPPTSGVRVSTAF